MLHDGEKGLLGPSPDTLFPLLRRKRRGLKTIVGFVGKSVELPCPCEERTGADLVIWRKQDKVGGMLRDFVTMRRGTGWSLVPQPIAEKHVLSTTVAELGGGPYDCSLFVTNIRPELEGVYTCVFRTVEGFAALRMFLQIPFLQPLPPSIYNTDKVHVTELPETTTKVTTDPDIPTDIVMTTPTVPIVMTTPTVPTDNVETSTPPISTALATEQVQLQLNPQVNVSEVNITKVPFQNVTSEIVDLQTTTELNVVKLTTKSLVELKDITAKVKNQKTTTTNLNQKSTDSNMWSVYLVFFESVVLLSLIIISVLFCCCIPIIRTLIIRSFNKKQQTRTSHYIVEAQLQGQEVKIWKLTKSV